MSVPKLSKTGAPPRTAVLFRQLRAELDKPPAMARGVLHLCCGALRSNDENPDQPLMRSCAFTTIIETLCIELGVPHTTHLIDLHNKPEWFTRLFSEGRAGSDLGKPATPGFAKRRNPGASGFETAEPELAGFEIEATGSPGSRPQ